MVEHKCNMEETLAHPTTSVIVYIMIGWLPIFLLLSSIKNYNYQMNIYNLVNCARNPTTSISKLDIFYEEDIHCNNCRYKMLNTESLMLQIGLNYHIYNLLD